MKLMDEVAGIVAARHCKTNIVTASVDAINFHEKIKKGEGWARLGHLCSREPRWAPGRVVGRQSRKQPWGGWHPMPGRWRWALHRSAAPSALHTRAVLWNRRRSAPHRQRHHHLRAHDLHEQ